MKGITWEWRGSSSTEDHSGFAEFTVGVKTLTVYLEYFADANLIYGLLREAYLLGKETGVHEVCVAVRKACNETCPG